MYRNTIHKLNSFELYHHGVKGQRWGVRRYQNADGSLTEAGKKRYGYGQNYDHGLVIRKGTHISRISMEENEEETGRTYASFKTGDVEKYIENGKMLCEMFGNSLYKYGYVARETLRIPSRREKVDLFLKAVQNDPVFKHKGVLNKSRIKQERAYDRFSYSLVKRNKRSQAYFSILTDAGYNAMLDDADMRKRVSDMPLLVIDRGKTLSLKSIKKLTDD